MIFPEPISGNAETVSEFLTHQILKHRHVIAPALAMNAKVTLKGSLLSKSGIKKYLEEEKR